MARTSPKRFAVRRSSIHGRGVFALTDIRKGDFIIDYGGEIITWDEAQARLESSSMAAGHTFYFDLDDDHVIDGGRGGNASRWINHGCDPNCEAVQDAKTVYIQARRRIRPGEELLIDYHLIIEDDASAEARADYACACGAASCRATMLAT